MTGRLIEAGLGLDWATLPADVQAAAKTFLLDTVTVGFAGSTTPEAARVHAAVRRWGDGDEAPVIGHDWRLPAPAAAFVNGFQIHCLEWDCVHEQAVVHAMSVPTAALLAEAARAPATTGADLLAGLVAAVDLSVNLGMAATAPLRFFRPATAGLMGAALGLSRMAGSRSASEAADALGLAYSQVSGTMQAHVEGSIALPLQIAFAARGAVTAHDLAAAGSSGPHDVIEGPFGYFALIEEQADPARIADRLGKNFGIAELSHKPFPTGRAAHAVLDGLNVLMAQDAIQGAEIERIDAFVPPLIARLVGRPAHADMTPSYARLCLPYLAASQIMQGALGPASYTAERLQDGTVLSLAERVSVHTDGTHDPNAMSPQRLELHLKDGRALELHIPHTLGAPGNPLSEAAQDQKALACLAPALGDGAGQRLDALKRAIDDLPRTDCGELVRLLAR